MSVAGQSGIDAKYVVGIDCGTLSGGAAVARVSDRAELGSGVHEYGYAVIGTTLASTGATVPPEWALQIPSDYIDAPEAAAAHAYEAHHKQSTLPHDHFGRGTNTVMHRLKAIKREALK